MLWLLLACSDSGTFSPVTRDDPVADPTTSSPVQVDLIEPCEATDGLLAFAPELPELLEMDGLVSGERAACQAVVHPFVAPAGQTVAIRLDGWVDRATVSFLDLRGHALEASQTLEIGESASFTPAWSGEFLVRVEPGDLDAEAHEYALSLTCEEACDLWTPRYPVVLVHGAAPADYLGLVDYFYAVRPTLEDLGVGVIAPVVDPFAGVDGRAAELAHHLDEFVDSGRARRFNLVAHSQGGLDARYLVSTLGYGDRVATLTSVAVPHRGTAVADAVNGMVSLSPLDGWLIDAAADALASLLGLGDQDPAAALADMTSASTAQFNLDNPDDAQVRYFSWSGRSCGLLEFGCQADTDGEIVAAYLGITYTLVELLEGPNDGMVSVDSAIWGEYLGQLPADHMDQIGQIVDFADSGFDHLGFFVDEARRLEAQGF